ncbi:transcriptional regulator of acetoin/glycerol metabolism [Mycolicibacterium sp. BK556]|uniref:helix-turn-helix domain-containing protein n=1 Tax=Mycobacteriaceae TaxID=1762 RepID=UPI00105386A2|nr:MULTISPECIES: helix-turn-helix domain-containing protein [Mycobacteriaceae]MBB3606468.1 transcriptional regulator of acetoin/glycerol metabolism [Mycolicibacterium sp. BK556]MBB3636286.1 transcriptional regulator of acetoin/glycerol metabolism [Mycolicibacterium sp. BK607]TDO06428.1 transcriptional regulator of acetoin/glycerol metabolism [Mycobacterium sp. BK086]
MSDEVRQVRQELMRVGLLGDVRTDGVVPDLIVRSWRRSISMRADGANPAQRCTEIDTDSILRRAADPVLDRWQSHLADTGTTLFLSDRSGAIVARRASDGTARRRLDRVHAAEGFDYSEDSIGTNGLGTSMVEKRALLISGSQHYNDALATLACAAAPVCTPSGSVIGSISLGGPIESANPLMLSLTREIGQQIEERLRSSARPQDLALAMSFTRFTNSQRPTVVMDSESILANTPGLPYIDVTSHVMLWELLNSHDWTAARTLRLQPDGTTVEVLARRVIDGTRTHFVLHFADLEPVMSRAVDASPDSGVRSSIVTTDAQGTPSVVVVEGPAGSGRATRAQSLRPARPSGQRFEEIVVNPSQATAWDAAQELLRNGTDVLLRRAENIPEADAEHAAALLREHLAASIAGQRSSALMVTADRDRCCVSVSNVLDEIGYAASTQPLSATPERIPALVKRVLDRVDPTGRHTMSPAALQSFVQWGWPGNLTELVQTLATVVKQVPTSVIERRHLPRHLQQAPPRRHLTLLEAAERDAIIKALDAASGNKSEAAALLGMGRTTLYRRLRLLGLDTGETSL